MNVRTDRRRTVGAALAALALSLGLGACQQQMADQPRLEPLQESEFFEDGRAARPLVEGTVARGYLADDEHLYRGTIDGNPVDKLPFAVDKSALRRGQERYDIFCAPCHDRTGGGQGMIVRRGFRAPASFHIDRLRQAPVGVFFEHITKGFGTMPDYAQQISPEDRWAIVAYIRALQLSQNARLSEIPESERRRLESEK